jgi:hypothetical protein
VFKKNAIRKIGTVVANVLIKHASIFVEKKLLLAEENAGRNADKIMMLVLHALGNFILFYFNTLFEYLVFSSE